MTAIDINPVLLELVPTQNVTVQQMDLRTGELPSESFDLVTCRALLHQIAEYAHRSWSGWPRRYPAVLC